MTSSDSPVGEDDTARIILDALNRYTADSCPAAGIVQRLLDIRDFPETREYERQAGASGISEARWAETHEVAAEGDLLAEIECLRTERLTLARLADYAVLIAAPQMVQTQALADAVVLCRRVLTESKPDALP